MTNDVATLDALFRDDPRTIRYGGGENLYGYDEIAAFRAGALAGRPGAHACRRPSSPTYGRDVAVASTLFHRDARPARSAGRCRPGCGFAEGWRVVAAHVSMIERARDMA